ncbi:MAG: siderophore-interacting protein [Buchananella hordeovulneris]|nr:siderophore-interacting protein [Buchananella hordeovulneris]
MAHSERSETLRPRMELPAVLRQMKVARVEELSPHMRRLVFVGPELLGQFPGGEQCPPLSSPNFDDHCKVFVVPSGQENFERATPEYGRGAALPECLRGRGRHYTIRRWDPQAGELTIDFLRHGGGLVSDWAFTASVDDVAYLGGPRATAAAPRADWYVFAVDQTALPAVERWLEELRGQVRAEVLVAVPHAEEKRALPVVGEAEAVDIRWIEVPAGGTAGEQMAAALQNWNPPCGLGYAWIAGEAGEMRALREALERHLPAERVEVGRYWCR